MFQCEWNSESPHSPTEIRTQRGCKLLTYYREWEIPLVEQSTHVIDSGLRIVRKLENTWGAWWKMASPFFVADSPERHAVVKEPPDARREYTMTKSGSCWVFFSSRSDELLAKTWREIRKKRSLFGSDRLKRASVPIKDDWARTRSSERVSGPNYSENDRVIVERVEIWYLLLGVELREKKCSSEGFFGVWNELWNIDCAGRKAEIWGPRWKIGLKNWNS